MFVRCLEAPTSFFIAAKLLSSSMVTSGTDGDFRLGSTSCHGSGAKSSKLTANETSVISESFACSDGKSSGFGNTNLPGIKKVVPSVFFKHCPRLELVKLVHKTSSEIPNSTDCFSLFHDNPDELPDELIQEP
jgi:hypothetical protein